MKKLVTLVVCLSLLIAISCDVPDTVERIGRYGGTRTGSFAESDLTYQWKVYWIDKDTYGWHTTSNDACLGSLWYYFSPSDYSSGDVIEGNWYVTNESCSGSHTGQALLDDYQNDYGLGFESWNNIPTYPQRYSFNKATGGMTLTRYVSLGAAVYKSFTLSLATDKQSGFITCYSPYNDIRIVRETGGPSVP